MIITCDDSKDISDLEQYLNQFFEMKDLGSLGYVPSLEVPSNTNVYYLPQEKYASDIPSKSSIINFIIASTLLNSILS